MEWTFILDKEGPKIYEGTGDQKEKVSLENMGWQTSPEFGYLAREIYNTLINEVKRVKNSSKGRENLKATLELDLKYEPKPS